MSRSFGLDLITCDDWNDNILPRHEEGTPTQGYYDRIAYQTLLEPNRIHQAYQNNSGYIAMTCRLSGGTQFNLNYHAHHPSTDWQVFSEKDRREFSKANPILLATRLHFDEPHQMPGLAILADKFEDYWSGLKEAMNDSENNPFHHEMNIEVGTYWPELTQRNGEPMHGKFQLDLITPFQLKHGMGVKSPMFRIQIPKDWGRILFGRLSDDIPEDEDKILEFTKRLSISFDEKKVNEKAEKAETTPEAIKHLVINDKLANQVECPICRRFTSSRRSMWGHLTEKHHERKYDTSLEKWLEKNPVEPLISLRKLALPEPHESAPAEYHPRPRPEGAPTYLHHLTYPAMVTLNHNKDTNKWTMSVPLWAKKQLFTRLNITSIGVEILWHSPNIVPGTDWNERGRSKTTIPTPWDEKHPGKPMIDTIQATGQYDRKYKCIKFSSNFNHRFTEWDEQGLKSGMICLVKLNVDVPSHGPIYPPEPEPDTEENPMRQN